MGIVGRKVVVVPRVVANELGGDIVEDITVRLLVVVEVWKGAKPPDNAIITTNITTGMERKRTTKKHLKNTRYRETRLGDSEAKDAEI